MTEASSPERDNITPALVFGLLYTLLTALGFKNITRTCERSSSTLAGYITWIDDVLYDRGLIPIEGMGMTSALGVLGVTVERIALKEPSPTQSFGCTKTVGCMCVTVVRRSKGEFVLRLKPVASLLDKLLGEYDGEEFPAFDEDDLIFEFVGSSNKPEGHELN